MRTNIYITNKNVNILFDASGNIFSEKIVYIVGWDYLSIENKRKIHNNLLHILSKGRIRIYTKDLQKSGLSGSKLEEFTIEEKYNEKYEMPNLVSRMLNSKDRRSVKIMLDEYFSDNGVQGVRRLVKWLNEQGYKMTKDLSNLFATPNINPKIFSAYLAANRPLFKQLVYPKYNRSKESKERKELIIQLKEEYSISTQEAERIVGEWEIWNDQRFIDRN